MKLRPSIPFIFYTYLILCSFTQLYASEIESSETNPTKPVPYSERAYLQSECEESECEESDCEESDYSSFTNNLQYRDEVTTPQNPINLLSTNEFIDIFVFPLAMVIYIELLSYFGTEAIVIGSAPLLLAAYFAPDYLDYK